MARSNNIFEAAAPEPYRVLGLQLKPFGLGHYMLLQRHGCAFVSHEKETATRADLIFAVLVCSMTFDEFQSWSEVRRVTLSDRLKTTALLCIGMASLQELECAWCGSRSTFSVMQWGRKIGAFNLEEKCQLFQRYLFEHSEFPKYWDEGSGNGKESGSHWSHNVYLVLTGDLGFSRTEALNMPLREGLLHYFKHAEALGVASLMTDREIKETDGLTSSTKA